MTHRHVTRPLLALPLAFCFGACSLLAHKPGAPTHDHTFISYWPAPRHCPEIRLAVKDNIDMQGIVTTAGSEYLAKNSPPAAHDAACLAIARERGVRIVGKVNLSEFAVSPSGINDYFGTPPNPFSGWRKLIPGGSSCGSAEAIACGKADIAFGTDTAGSIRVPAACCGVVGLKTTFGLVPLDGVFPIDAQHLDTVGPIAETVEGTALGMDLLQKGFATKYAAAVAATPTAQTIRIGRLHLHGTEHRIDQAVDDALTRAGFQVVPLDDSFRVKWDQATKDGTAVAASGAWISDRKYASKFGVSARTKSVIAVGGVAYATQYKQALARRDDWQRALSDVFKKVDLIALPTLQSLPPRLPPTLKLDLLNAQAGISNLENTLAFNVADPVKLVTSVPAAALRLVGIDLLEADMLKLQNTVAVNYAGNPAVAIPIPFRKGGSLVTSVQFIAPPNSEARLLAAARFVESTSD